VRVKCASWLKDINKGCKYITKYLQAKRAKTRPLPTPKVKGNLLLTKKVQVIDKRIDEAC
jgi:hypothetical protein